MQTTIVIPCYNEANRLDRDAYLRYAEVNASIQFLKNYKEAIPYLEASLQNYPSLAGLLQQCKVLCKTQSSPTPTNTNNKSEITTQQSVTNLFKLE